MWPLHWLSQLIHETRSVHSIPSHVPLSQHTHKGFCDCARSTTVTIRSSTSRNKSFYLIDQPPFPVASSIGIVRHTILEYANNLVSQETLNLASYVGMSACPRLRPSDTHTQRHCLARWSRPREKRCGDGAETGRGEQCGTPTMHQAGVYRISTTKSSKLIDSH